MDYLNPVEHLVREWADYTYERLLRQLQRRGIYASGELQQSLRHQIDLAGPLIIARFSFALQGKFVDMGVGKGVSVNNRGAYRQAYTDLKVSGGRKANKWFNKPFYGRYYWLAEAIPTQIAERIVLNTAPALTHTINDGN